MEFKNRKKAEKQYENKKTEKTSIFKEFINMFLGEAKKSTNAEVSKGKNKKVAKKGENITTEIKVSISEAFYGVEKSIALRTIDGKMKQFKVKIPAGIRNNEKIRLMGQGKPGEHGGKPGDLLINVFLLFSYS